MINDLKDKTSPVENLSREELTDVIDLALWAGQLLLQYGATSRRVEETVHQIGTALGCDWLDVLVSYNAITVSSNSGGDFRTKIRRVVNRGVNMTIVSAIYRLRDKILNHKLNRTQVRQELDRISHKQPIYNRWLIVIMIGLACAAFSRLFGGDWIAFGITFTAASIAMFTRQVLQKHYFNPLLITLATAFIATIITGLSIRLNLGTQPEIALAASVLLLIPGVPLVNSVIDVVRGYVVIGMARGIAGALITFAIALGMLLAMQLLGVSGL
ncbi:MAG TPA: threonine/serine exporter family protein [Balneolales bacterium]|nr:threonine/serine exporter family protein [Balneolales bacterium]